MTSSRGASLLYLHINTLFSPLLQVKSGKEFLKDYYLKHRALSEKDLDDLVTKSSMSYEQVRDWFSQTARRVEAGKEPFSNEEEEGEEEEEEETPAEAAGSEGEMEVKEQGEEAKADGSVKGESEDGCEMEEEHKLQGGEGVSQSQPPTEEQT